MADRLAVARRLLAAGAGSAYAAAQLVVVEQGEEILAAEIGCRPDERFDVASLTKPLATVTLALRAVEEGRLSLDDEPRPGVTLRDALCHATGLPAWEPLGGVGGGRGDRRRAIFDHCRNRPLVAAPGERSVYSDLGFLLLGAALEEATGARLDEQWRPIGRLLGVAAGYHPPPALCVPTHREPALRGVVDDDNARAMGGVAPHAGLFSTARDVSAVAAHLVAVWHGTEGILSPPTLRAAWSPCAVPGSVWCLGWDRPSPGASQAGARWPRDGVGHLGFTGCSLWVDPPRRRWVVLLSNRVLLGPPALDALRRLRPALHDAVVEALDGPGGVP